MESLLQARWWVGDAWAIVPTLPPSSVDCVVTSPPYWGQRDYGVPGQFGVEPDPDAYVARLVALFEGLRTVLKPTGTIWLNLGDSYAKTRSTNGGFGPRSTLQGATGPHIRYRASNRGGTAYRLNPGTPRKSLLGMPWRVALALIQAGWILRSDIIWVKPNAMPESVRDRPTESHEYLFFFTGGQRYWFCAAALAEPAQWANQPQRNGRSVWTIPTQPSRWPHLAPMPDALVRRCIAAGCPPGGVVLDPFAGVGTVLRVANQLGRHGWGIELHPDYVRWGIQANPQLAWAFPGKEAADGRADL